MTRSDRVNRSWRVQADIIDSFPQPVSDAMCTELDNDLSTALPRDWTESIRSAVLNIVVLVRIATLAAREFLIQEGDVVHAKLFRLEGEVAMLREELRINGTRIGRIDPHRRPQYPPIERMAILELRAMRGWSKAETARRFFVSDHTIRSWLRRADDDTLLQTRTPVNRFPDVVRYAVQRIKLFCPTLGKVKIAQKLARAGIHIGKTTVERILKENPAKEPASADTGKQSRIVSKYPSHTWHTDLTAVPISGGFSRQCFMIMSTRIEIASRSDAPETSTETPLFSRSGIGPPPSAVGALSLAGHAFIHATIPRCMSKTAPHPIKASLSAT